MYDWHIYQTFSQIELRAIWWALTKNSASKRKETEKT